MPKSAKLITIDWPDFGPAEPPAAASAAELAARILALRDAAGARDLSHVVIYGDREHFANIAWATGIDPRFEEALLIVGPEAKPLFVVGNECWGYLGFSAAYANGDLRAERYQTFSLLSQPRSASRRLTDILAGEGIGVGSRVGCVGWKYFAATESADPEHTIDLPGYMVDALRGLAGAERVVNATDLMMHPGHGLRATASVSEIVAFEFANVQAAAAVRRMLFALKPGLSDFEAFEAGRLSGLPLGCHSTFATGRNRDIGLAGPTGEILTLGEPLGFNVCHFGSNICRVGWIARDANDLPAPARDYVGAFAGPYVEAVAEWYAMMRPGVSGGAVYDMIQRRLPAAQYDIFLNPGHLIHLDEWLSSPIFEGSDLPLRSGMVMQCDIIPSNPVYASTRAEDGLVIADAELRARLAAAHPDVYARMQARRRFMIEVLGFDVPETVLPLSDMPAIVPPFLLAPTTVIALR